MPNSRLLPPASMQATLSENGVPAAPNLWAGPTTPTTDPNASRIGKVIYEASVLLPKQAILDNFVHHNPWEILQGMDFFEANKYVEECHAEMSPGERMFAITNMDPRARTNEALAELCAAFLDRGSAKWEPPNRDKGFLYFFASLEGLGFVPWRKHARKAARRILELKNQHPAAALGLSDKIIHTVDFAEQVLQENLEWFGAQPEQWLSTTRSMLLDLPGWAGMFQRMQEHPEEAPPNVKIQLADFCAVQSILTRSSIESLACCTGCDSSQPIGSLLSKAPSRCKRDTDFLSQDVHEACHSPSSLAYIDQNSAQFKALEKQYERTTLLAIGEGSPSAATDPRPILQFFTCIDERECSFRRHLEQATGNAKEIETFGIPGFMSFQIYYQASDGREQCILGPEGCTPGHTLVEDAHREDEEKTDRWNRRRRFVSRLELMWEDASLSPIWSLLLVVFLPFLLLRLLLMTLFPNTTRRLNAAFFDTILPTPRTDFNHPCTIAEGAKLLSLTFQNIGVKDRFAPIIVIFGHGSRSVNNPFDAAHNCGACGGREGGPNARLMARCANDKAVRAKLRSDYDISIPDDTWFIGAFHDTTSELVELFDVELIPSSFQDRFRKAQDVIYEARGRNAFERCQKFMLAHVKTKEQALQHVHTRSTDLGEARPELGHATNAAVILGRRVLTKGRFLARRAFLPSYDPFADDDKGTNLERVLAPGIIVCSGISLEYLYSTTEGGAGTKVPMNLVGLAGVMQGTSGDLRIGLPTQMTEMHAPLRALFVIDAPPDRIEAVLSRREELRQIVHNDWIRLFARDHKTKQLYRQSHGNYIPVDIEAVPMLINPKIIDIEAGARLIKHDLEHRCIRRNVPLPEDLTNGHHFDNTADCVSFDHHEDYTKMVASREHLLIIMAFLSMVASCAAPIYMYGHGAMNPHGPLIAVGATQVSVCALAFSRRYLHGEFMYGRLTLLLAGMLLGFNLVATAPSLEHAMTGWQLLAFTSVFLIGVYNDRPTARDNATFVFFTYKLSDAALLIATKLSANQPNYVVPAQGEHASLIAVALIIAALLHSGQFSVTNLFMRSMEGPAPTSALGYAGLGAHAGIVLLSSTMPQWFGFVWARVLVASVGFISAVSASLVAKIRADRKGALAAATSSTLGMIYVVLAAGYANAALVLSLGHAAFRILQFLRSANFILDVHNLKIVLGDKMEPKAVPAWLYKLSWMFSRFNSGIQMPHVLGLFSLCCWPAPSDKTLHRFQNSRLLQWMVTFLLLVLAGMPWGPIATLKDHLLSPDFLLAHPVKACCLMALDVVTSTASIRFIFANVLNPMRFRHQGARPKDLCRNL